MGGSGLKLDSGTENGQQVWSLVLVSMWVWFSELCSRFLNRILFGFLNPILNIKF